MSILNFKPLLPLGKLKVRTPSKCYRAHNGARRWWAEVHDDRGLFKGKGSYPSREAARAAAQEMIDA